jgi:hypothetical protein
MHNTSRLPARFPVGTKYVLESRGALVHRYVEFPNGRRVQFELRKAQTCNCAAWREISIAPTINAATASSHRMSKLHSFTEE